MFRPADILAICSDSYGLVLGELSLADFLSQARELTKADHVTFIRWLDNAPDTQKITSVGDAARLPHKFKQWLDSSLKRDHNLPVTLNELATKTPADDDATHKFINDPYLMAVLMDTQPSRLLILYTRNAASEPWSDAERQSYMEVAAVMRKSVRLHKQIDAMKGALQASKALFNSSPAGMIIMRPDHRINLANRMATKILAREDGIAIRNDRLVIDHQPLHEEFQQLLDSSLNMTADEALSFKWHRGVPRKFSQTAYQLSVQVLCLPEWHIESRHFDKIILALLADPLSVAAPSTDQLKRYYGYTGAQAKLALALWGGTGVAEAADKLSISINTARTHMRAIYEKTGVTSHAELMAVLTTSLNRSTGMSDGGDLFQPGIASPKL